MFRFLNHISDVSNILLYIVAHVYCIAEIRVSNRYFTFCVLSGNYLNDILQRSGALGETVFLISATENEIELII